MRQDCLDVLLVTILMDGLNKNRRINLLFCSLACIVCVYTGSMFVQLCMFLQLWVKGKCASSLCTIALYINLCIYTFLFISRVCRRVCVERRGKHSGFTVKQHLVRQASPQGKAAYCGHKPWWLSALGGLHMRTNWHAYIDPHTDLHKTMCAEKCMKIHIYIE